MGAPKGLQFAKVFADLELNTKGFKTELAASERSLGRIEQFITQHPMAAAGALAGAFVLVGIRATQMAAQTDTAIRKINAVLPDAVSKSAAIKAQIDAIATASGRSQAELLQTAEVIARGGVANTEELLQRLRVVQTAADATGADLATVANGLDQVLDTFGLAGDQIEEVAAKLRAAGQGREPLEDLLGSFQAAAPTLKAAGVSFDVATNALARFVGEGLNSKQANKALKDLVEQGGAKAVEEFGGKAINAAEAIRSMNAASNDVANGSDRLGERIRANLNTALRDLGDLILPVVTSELQGIVGLLDLVAGKTTGIKNGQSIATINTLAPLTSLLQNPSKDKLEESEQAARRLYTALHQVSNAAVQGQVDLKGLNATQLEQLRQNVELALADLGPRVDGFLLPKVQAFQQQIQDAITAALTTPPATPGRTTSSTSNPILTEEQKTALRKGLVDTFTAQLPHTIEETTAAVVGLAEGLTRLGTKPEDVTKAIKPLIDRLKELRDAAQDQALNEGITAALGSPSATESLQRLSDLSADLVAQINAEAEGSERTAVLKERLLRVTQAIAQVNAQIEGIQTVSEDLTDRTADNLERQAKAASLTASELGRIARGALGIAQAFGVVNDRLALVLQNVVTIGESLPDLVTELAKLNPDGSRKKGPDGLPLPVDTNAIAASTIAILGSLAAVLSGESPGARLARQIQEDNTRAIEENTRKIDSQSKGSTVTAANAAAATLLAALPKGTPGRVVQLDKDAVNRLLEPLNLTLTELKALAKDLGVTLDTGSLNDFLATLAQLQERIAKTRLGAFTNDFAGQLAALQEEFDLLDLTNPLDQLERLRDLITSSAFTSPALKNLLAGLDLNDPSQRAEAERRLQDLFNRLRVPGLVTPGELGGLGGDELADLIRQIESMIDQINEQNGTVTGGPRQETFGVVRNITDTQADKLISLEIGQLDTLLEIRDLFAAAFTPIVPPGLPGPQSNAGSLSIESVVVNLGLGTTAEEAFAAGKAVVAGIADEADRQFGLRMNAKKATFGNAVVR